MSDTFIPVKDLEWSTVKIHRQGETRIYDYELELFHPLAEWDVWDYWERERIQSMQQHIKQGDVVFDVGAEQGWMSALISKYMSDQVVLVEPTSEFWPGIKAIYERNNLRIPVKSFLGFATDETTKGRIDELGWPNEAKDDDVIEKRKYRNVYDSGDSFIDCRKIDDFGVVPDHLTIDVEGAELKVLKGAEQTLRKHKPLVWCSIHPDMALRDYGHTREDILFFMDDCGYEAELLAVDHEHHILFTPKIERMGKIGGVVKGRDENGNITKIDMKYLSQ